MQSEAHAESALQGAARRYLGNDVPILSVDLSNGSQLSQAGKDLVELKRKMSLCHLHRPPVLSATSHRPDYESQRK